MPLNLHERLMELQGCFPRTTPPHSTPRLHAGLEPLGTGCSQSACVLSFMHTAHITFLHPWHAQLAAAVQSLPQAHW